jgi:sugar phosphate permease
MRWGILSLLVAFSYMNYFNRISLQAVESQVRSEYGLSTNQFALFATAMLAAYTIAMTPAGWLIDAVGAKRALAIMGFGTAFFTLVTGMAGLLTAAIAFPVILLIRAGMGACAAPIYPASGRMNHGWFPPDGRALANGLVTAAAPIGGALAHPLFAGMADQLGWRVAFAISGGFTAFFAFVWVYVAKDAPEEPSDHTDFAMPTATVAALPSPEAQGRWTDLFENRSLWLLTFSYGALGWLQYILFYWIGHYFSEVLKYPDDVSRRYSMIATMMMGFTMPLGGWVADVASDRWGRRSGRASVASLGMVVSAIFLIAAGYREDARGILICFCISSAAIGLIDGPAWATAVELGGRRGGTSAGIFNTGGNIGGVLATYLSAAIGERFGWDYSLWVGGIICFIGGLLWLGVDPDERCADK